MRKLLKTTLVALMALGLTAGKKDKKKEDEAPAPAPAATESAPATADDPAPDEPEAAPAPAPVVPNADFNAKIVHGGGATTSGHVIRVERSEDWYAEEGWTDKPVKLTVTVEGNGTEKDVAWTGIKSIDISYLGKSNVDCTYDSEYTPLMWTCTMKTKSTVALAEGGTWEAASRHKWRFTFEDGKVEEFWINKLPNRQQEDSVADMNSPDRTEVVNVELQLALQEGVIAQAATAVTRIEITPK